MRYPKTVLCRVAVVAKDIQQSHFYKKQAFTDLNCLYRLMLTNANKSAPKVIWERAASRRGVASTSSGPWRSLMNMHVATTTLLRRAKVS